MVPHRPAEGKPRAENRIPANVNHSLRVDAAQGPEILGKCDRRHIAAGAATQFLNELVVPWHGPAPVLVPRIGIGRWECRKQLPSSLLWPSWRWSRCRLRLIGKVAIRA